MNDVISEKAENCVMVCGLQVNCGLSIDLTINTIRRNLLAVPMKYNPKQQ